jgi:hypothetical protein
LPKKGEVKPQVYVAKILDIKKEQLQEEEAPKPQATAPPQPTTPLPQPTTGGTAPRETARCVVVGYTVENDEVTSLVVARQEGDELRYVGTVRPTLTPEEKDDLLKRFGRLASSRPVFRNFERPVVWLKPKLNCEVEHTGTGEDALLKEARFKGLVEDDKPDAAPGKKPTSRAPTRPRPGRTTAGATPRRP